METYNYKHIDSNNANTTVKVAALAGATLGKITIQKTSAHALTVYDAASDSDTSTPIAIIKASIVEQTLEYNVVAKKGIFIAVPASYAGDATISYR